MLVRSPHTQNPLRFSAIKYHVLNLDGGRSHGSVLGAKLAAAFAFLVSFPAVWLSVLPPHHHWCAQQGQAGTSNPCARKK